VLKKPADLFIYSAAWAFCTNPLVLRLLPSEVKVVFQVKVKRRGFSF
jgi:hypothetical protein